MVLLWTFYDVYTQYGFVDIQIHSEGIWWFSPSETADDSILPVDKAILLISTLLCGKGK